MRTETRFKSMRITSSVEYLYIIFLLSAKSESQSVITFTSHQRQLSRAAWILSSNSMSGTCWDYNTILSRWLVETIAELCHLTAWFGGGRWAAGRQGRVVKNSRRFPKIWSGVATQGSPGWAHGVVLATGGPLPRSIYNSYWFPRHGSWQALVILFLGSNFKKII